MDSEQQLAQIDDIFLEAVELESAEARAAFLDCRCAELEPRIRIEVEKLLAADKEAFTANISAAELNIAEFVATTAAGSLDDVEQTVGPYRLLQKLGEGGMGVVYMADQKEPVRRRVAIKLVKPGMDSKQVVARFEAERQALAMMEHPNIAKVLDVGTTELGRPYFVMELVKGVPITKYCDENQLSVRSRLKLLVSVCHAVQHAHQKGVIHRDLKPSNILVAEYDNDPIPKVIDFGLAKALQQSLTEKTMFTRFDQVVGTYEYMSPEQSKFNQLDIDTRTDVYSLGVLLYELLTGATPLDSKTLRAAAIDELLRIIREVDPPRPSTRLTKQETATKIAANRAVDPSQLNSLLRGDLDAIVMKALDKERNRRYETCSALADDIKRFLNDQPVEAAPPSTIYYAGRFIRRNRTAVAIVGLVLLTLFAATILTTSAWLKADRMAKNNTVIRLATESRALRNEQPVLSVLLAIEAYEMGKGKQNEVQSIADEALLNASQQLHYGRTLSGHKSKISSVAMSNDWLVSLGDAGVRLWDLSARTPSESSRLLGRDKGEMTAVDVSDDGHWLVTAGRTLQRWDLTVQHPNLSPSSLSEVDVPIRALKSSSDGRIVAAQTDDGAIYIWDVSTEEAPSPSVMRGNSTNVGFALSADGNWIAAVPAVQPDAVRVWKLQSDQEPEKPLLLEGQQDDVRKVALSRDGRSIAAAFENRSIAIWDLAHESPASQVPRTIAIDQHMRASVLRFSKDSRWLYTHLGYAPRILRWDLHSQNPASTRTVSRHRDRVTAMKVSRDGKWLISGSRDGTVRFWDVAAPNPAASLVLPAHDVVRDFALHPNGRWFATVGFDGTAKLWDLLGANPELSPFVLRGKQDDIFSASAISSNGRWIATSVSDNAIQLWDTESKNAEQFDRILEGAKATIGSVEISRDDHWLVAGSRDGRAQIWDLTKHDVASTLVVVGNANSTDYGEGGLVTIGPHSRWLVKLAERHQIEVWDLGSKDFEQPSYIFDDCETPILSASISPDGRWLAVGGQGNEKSNEAKRCNLTVWDLAANDPRSSAKKLLASKVGMFSIAFDGTSRWLTTPGPKGGTLRWDMHASNPGESPRTLQPTSSLASIWRLAISPNSRWLLTGRFDYSAQLRDLSHDPPKNYELRRHRGVQSVAISPDGCWLAAGCPSNAYLWDLTSLEPASTARVLRGHEDVIWSLRFSADNRWLITDGSDSTIRRWCLDTEWLKEYARTFAGRDLTPEERQLYGIH